MRVIIADKMCLYGQCDIELTFVDIHSYVNLFCVFFLIDCINIRSAHY